MQATSQESLVFVVVCPFHQVRTPARSSVCDPQTTANVFWPLSPLHKFISFDPLAIFMARSVLQLLASRSAVVDLNQGCRNCFYPHLGVLGGMSFFLSSAFQ
jgi:hypothetical protein